MVYVTLYTSLNKYIINNRRGNCESKMFDS